MKRILAIVGVLGVLLVLAAQFISPPHYFVVNAGSKAKAATLAVVDQPAQPATIFAGFVFARTDVVESAAVLEVTFADGSKRRCQFGYFTSLEVEPHYLTIDQCDARWH